MAGDTVSRQGVSRDGVHALLWGWRGAGDALHIDQTRLAAMLQVTKHTMSRTISRMVAEGRLEKLPGGKHSGFYRVTPPFLMEELD